MWLTGFDAPSLHTMYVDKPMRDHGLMQAITRVNRVYKNKPGGLIVDYMGLANELKKAVNTYTESGGVGRPTLDQDEAVAVMLEKYEVCCAMFHGFDWSDWTSGSAQKRMALSPPAQEHILALENGKDRFVQAVRELHQAFTLAVPHDETKKIRDDLAFFQFIQSALLKPSPGEVRSDEALDHAMRQIISRAVAPEGVIDVFEAAGLEKPDVSILSNDFLDEVRGMPHRNLAVELLQKLLKGELSIRRRRNLVQARSFAEMLERTLRRYQNRSIESAQVIEELIELAKEMRQANERGEVAGSYRRRDGFLRRPRDQRQRGQGHGERHTLRHCPRACRDRPKQRHHRLDTARERPRQPPPPGPPNPAQTRLPARQTGEGNPDRPRAGRGALRGMGGVSVTL